MLTSLFKNFWGVCPHPAKSEQAQPPLAAPAVFTLSGYGVAHASHVAMFSNLGGTCVSESLRMGLFVGYEGLNHHDVDGNGGPDIGTSS